MIYTEKSITSEGDYLDLYKQSCQENHKILNNALTYAYDIRKFEIELYWKRASFFWAFIATTFVALYSVINNNFQNINFKYDIAILISVFGIILSFSFFLMNKGSKYWQENWEKHIELLEDSITGPLYKTTLIYQKTLLSVVDPRYSYKVSISKITQIVSFYILILWVLIFIRVLSARYSFMEPFAGFNIMVISLYFISFLLFIKYSDSDKEMEKRNFAFKLRMLK